MPGSRVIGIPLHPSAQTKSSSSITILKVSKHGPLGVYDLVRNTVMPRLNPEITGPPRTVTWLKVCLTSVSSCLQKRVESTYILFC